MGRVAPLGVLVALIVVRGVLYAFLSPPWQGPDEPTHYHYLAALAADDQFFPKSISVLPEVYSAVWENATQYRIWDYNDWPIRGYVREVAPDEQFLARAGGLYYRFLFPVYGLTRTWPLEGQLFALRVWSAMLMVVTVAGVYAIARTILSADTPRERALAWSAAALVALHPMATFIGASLNDDNLVTPLATLTLLGVLRALRGAELTGAADTHGWWALAFASALGAVLTKRTGFAAIGFVGIGMLVQGGYWAVSGRGWRRWTGLLMILSFVVAVAGAGVLIGLHPELPPDLTWRIQLPADVLITLSKALADAFTQPWQNWYARALFLTLSFWGWFGWLRAPLGLAAISLLRYLSVIVALGVVVQGVIWFVRRSDSEARRRLILSLVLISSLGFNFMLLLAQHLVQPDVYILTGRYLFPALGAWSLLSVLGWAALWPRRWGSVGCKILIGLAIGLDVYPWLFVMVPFFYT